MDGAVARAVWPGDGGAREADEQRRREGAALEVGAIDVGRAGGANVPDEGRAALRHLEGREALRGEVLHHILLTLRHVLVGTAHVSDRGERENLRGDGRRGRLQHAPPAQPLAPRGRRQVERERGNREGEHYEISSRNAKLPRLGPERRHVSSSLKRSSRVPNTPPEGGGGEDGGGWSRRHSHAGGAARSE